MKIDDQGYIKIDHTRDESIALDELHIIKIVKEGWRYDQGLDKI